MAAFALCPHPDFPSPAIAAITAEVWRRDNGRFNIGFLATGVMDDLVWPGSTHGHSEGNFVASEAGRTDGLWQHSCFEAFCAKAGSPSYFEFNFATSGLWATYAFDDRRAGMRPAKEVTFIGEGWKIRPQRVLLNALIDLPSDFTESDWDFGLAAVIEAKDGTKSYWALAHAPGPPDFHNPDCFIATLPAPDAP